MYTYSKSHPFEVWHVPQLLRKHLSEIRSFGNTVLLGLLDAELKGYCASNSFVMEFQQVQFVLSEFL